MNGAERGLLQEVVILEGGPLSFLEMTEVCACELKNVIEFGGGMGVNCFKGTRVPCHKWG